MSWPRTRIQVPIVALLGAALSLPAAPFIASIPAHAPTPSAASELKARQIIARAIDAHGGRQAWLHKKDAAFSTTWTHFQSGQRSFSSRYLVKFPVSSGNSRTVVEAEENGKPVLMGVSGSQSWFVVGSERYQDLDSLKANRAFVKRAYNLLALPFRLDDPSYNFSYAGEEVRAGAVVDRVSVEHGLEPRMLYLFDRQTGRMAGMGSALTDPPTPLVGDCYEFTEVDGILIPSVQVFDRLDARTGGRERALVVSVDGVRFDNGFPVSTFEPPPPR